MTKTRIVLPLTLPSRLPRASSSFSSFSSFSSVVVRVDRFRRTLASSSSSSSSSEIGGIVVGRRMRRRSSSHSFVLPPPPPSRFLVCGMSFLSLNVIATLVHENDYAHAACYPFPFAIDACSGNSMLPTIGCGCGDDGGNGGGGGGKGGDFNLYLRDCWSHRFVWFDSNNARIWFRDWVIVRMMRGVGVSGWGWGWHGMGDGTRDESSSSTNDVTSLSRPWRRGDVVTLYHPTTRTTVTKRIIGIGGDVVLVHGEYSNEYRARRGCCHAIVEGGDGVMMVGERGGGGGGGVYDDIRIRGDIIDDDDDDENARRVVAMETFVAGVPHDVRYPIPFCRTISSLMSPSPSSGCEGDGRRSNDMGGGGTGKTTSSSSSSSSSLRNDDCATYVVPPNHVWVEGDNPTHSTDSRHYGPLPESSLRGRIVLRLWPVVGVSAGYSRDAVVGTKRPMPPDLRSAKTK
ncbi:hypothetical protein ACHAXA_001068 [Cyclostephanos tholiformis]|uniref:Peptidase S26 domain-containing protein n=1 Tax=Cyclostephanos tholiformis TaxID=382380 RepID=A0ABD3R6N0_9STRA